MRLYYDEVYYYADDGDITVQVEIKTVPDGVDVPEYMRSEIKQARAQIARPVVYEGRRPAEYTLWLDIRERRNELLLQSDWAVLPDSPLAAEEVAKWKAYRQELRDLPVSKARPEDVIFPIAPGKKEKDSVDIALPEAPFSEAVK